jgi:hypothetical protein
MFISTALSLSVDILVVPTKIGHHFSDLQPIRTYILVHFYFFLFDEVNGVVSTDSKEMNNFGPISTSAEMEQIFLF